MDELLFGSVTIRKKNLLRSFTQEAKSNWYQTTEQQHTKKDDRRVGIKVCYLNRQTKQWKLSKQKKDIKINGIVSNSIKITTRTKIQTYNIKEKTKRDAIKYILHNKRGKITHMRNIYIQ